ncbi:MAG: CDP-glycerol glycerophosphotransferase family protein [Microbacteriaceae bacterium]
MPAPAAHNAFARANTRKLVALPLYALGVAASVIVPRNGNLWAFGCGSGLGEGALPLLRIAAAAAPERQHVWLARTAAERDNARALGLHSVLKLSPRGFWTTLRARVLVVTHGLGDANRYATRGAFVVQLWHGIPLKLINLDSPVTTSSGSGAVTRVLARMYRLAASTISFMPAASPTSAARLRTAFGLPANRIAVTGDPRDDIIAVDDPGPARALLFRGIGSDDTGQRVVMYAPTWRDGARDPGIPTADEWHRIAAWLDATDSLLVVRPHPLGVGDYASTAPPTARIRMLTAAAQGDVNPILPGVDILITDYSSVAFDFSLTGRPIAFLAPDVAAYVASRGLYEPYRAFSGGSEATSWPELLDRLEEADAHHGGWDSLAAHSALVAERHFTFHDGHNAARVYAEITTRLKETPMTSTLPVGATLPDAVIDTIDVSLPDQPMPDQPMLTVGGPLTGGVPVSAVLRGPRLEILGEISQTPDRWSAHFTLSLTRWHGPQLAPPSGQYVLELSTHHASVVTTGLPPALPPEQLIDGHFRIGFAPADAAPYCLGVTLAPPLTDDEHGPERQAALERTYRAARPQPLDAVFFESFYGQNASCNPRAIDRAIATLRPQTARYWSTVDASVELPDGATRLVEGSAEWWRIRASARLIVVNDWLRKRYRPRRHQKVVQTWHGTPLKKIALSRPSVGLRTRIATLLESRRWDVLLAQNPHSAAILRTAYAFSGPVWQEGYPRDDILIDGDAAAVRKRLDIPDGVTVLLYAPTWRDDRPEHIDYLDVAAFADSMGPGYLTLIRGHSRTLRPGREVRGTNVLDVTAYPDVSELFLVADALITDYSSVMFDFSVTGKPIFFFAPDLEHYREQLRGFYFDLDLVALGPVVQRAEDLEQLVRDRVAVAETYAVRYAEWQARFNPRDDGGAAERVVRRFESEKFI